MTREQQIEAYIARNGVTTLPSAGKGETALSLRTLRNRQERHLCGDDTFKGDREVKEREVACAVRANGGSTSEALDAAREI